MTIVVFPPLLCGDRGSSNQHDPRCINSTQTFFFCLGTKAQETAIPASSPIMIGCRTLMPALEATAPVRKGKAAEPAWPVLAANPSEYNYNVSTY